jgi:hypothetical protein
MPWIPDFFAQKLMANIRYQDITPEERARKPQPVAVTLTYGWGVEAPETPSQVSAKRQRKSIK